MSLTPRQYKYNVISLALDNARTDVAQGLTTKLNTLTILTLGGGTLSARLNSASNDLITLSNGLKIEGIPITEIYWTNTAQPGVTAKVFVAWIDT